MPDETITQRISVEGADPLTLSGVNDANLTELAKQTGARVALRGDVLTVSGSSESVDRASAIAQRMIDAARQRMPLEADDVLAKVGWEIELACLLRQLADEILCEDLRESRHIEDVLLGIKSSQLSAKLRKRIENLRSRPAHSRIKGGEKTSRPASDDGNVLYLVHSEQYRQIWNHEDLHQDR